MDSDTERIKDRLSINEVVGQYVQLQRAGRNFRARCPFHNERTPSFMVSPERGSYMCFGCGERGDIFSFVQKMEGVDFPIALKQLAEKAGVKLTPRFGSARSEQEVSQVKEKEERLKEVCEEATKFFESTLKERADVAAYLHARGVKDETIASWRLGYAPASWEELSKHLVSRGFSKDEIVEAGLAAKSEKKPGEVYDRFRGRIMFPLFDPSGRVVAFSGRFFEEIKGTNPPAGGGEPAKYVNSPETVLFKKSKLLYGFDRAKNNIRKADCILLVEGQFDVIMCHQSGLPITVALSGTALTSEHLSLLSRLSKRLVLALDADAAGLRAGMRSTHMAFAAGFDVKVPAFPEGKDPADVAKENPELLKAAVRTSKTAIEFFLEALLGQARDERGYKKLVEAHVLPLIAALTSRIDQEHFARIVARALSVSESAVLGEVRKAVSTPLYNSIEAAEVPQTEVSLLPLEKAAGMLIFKFEKEEPMQERLRELLGKERYDLYIEKMAPDAERLRFEFDSLGEEVEETSGALLHTIERSFIEEEMKKLQGALGKGSDGEGELLKKLFALKMRQQELRK
jgi:DNA primase